MFKVFAGWKRDARQPARALTKMLVGPWTHQAIGSRAPFGDVDFGPSSEVDIPGEHLRWYDWRLKQVDTSIDRQGALRLFVMGPTFTMTPIRRDDVVRHVMAGGGGWGDPRRRDPEAVRTDVLAEKVTIAHARDAYGVVIDPETLEIDRAATGAVREGGAT